MHPSNAWKTGVKDGWKSPTDLSSGMTYDTHCDNEAYDRGVNLGQRMKRGLIALTALGPVAYMIVDRLGHLFGICIGH